jgi:glyoxylase-like metal-dependent hydrolase (beta-lactamase superfamily II)
MTRSPALLGLLSLVLLSCAKTGDVEVLKEVTGPGETNCYLVYDVASKEAALIDVGGEVAALVETIRDKGLHLKYIFATHGHMDHMEGTPAMRERFPDAQFCCSRVDYEDFLVQREWAIEHLEPREIEAMREHPGYSKWFEYDMAIFKEPDIYLEDGQVFRLGSFDMKTIHSPGHSRGSMCFHVSDALFSGDVLFYRRVGHTEFMHGSMEELTISVRRLYNELPDFTVVYPGHGETTDIGSEKFKNEAIRGAS